MGCAQVGKPGSRLIRLWLLPLVLFASGSGPLMAQTLLGEDISELYAPGEERPAWVRPKVLNPEDVGIGETVPDFGFVDVSGKSGRLSDLLHERAGLVIAIRDTACPVSARYAPTLARLEKEFADRNVGFLFLNPSRHDDALSIERELGQNQFDGPYVHEPNADIVGVLGAVSTSEVFLLNSRHELVYRGAIDDQYGIGYVRDTPSHEYLLGSLNAMLDDRLPGIAATTAPGCFLNPATGPVKNTDITYYKDIAPIVQDNCQRCHRPGESGPFPLLRYEDVAYRRGIIRFVLQNRVMPPWFAAPGTGPWMNDRRLEEEDRATFLSWLENGTPAGNPEDAPAPRVWATGWRNGEPDIIFEVPESFNIPAEGTMPYQYAVLETGFAESRWIQGLEVRSLTPELVHHITVFRIPHDFDMNDRFKLLLNGYFAALAPGSGPLLYPSTMAKRLPAGYDLMFQIHYQPNGTPGRDRPRLGLKFADQPPRYEIESGSVTTVNFDIPAGSGSHRVQATRYFEEDVRILGFAPHMHVRGKSFTYELVFPDGLKETVLDIPRYDFDWQLFYRLETPREIPAGTQLLATGVYDNSRANPRNPDPTKNVKFGPQWYDEMLIGYYDWYRP